MAKQTFTAGQVLTATQMNNLQANDYNWSTNAQVASYVLVAADAGKVVTMTNAAATTITVNTSLFTAGDTVRIINLGAGACTITAGTATVSTAGSLILVQNQAGTLWFSSTSAAIFIPDDKTPGLQYITGASFSAVSSFSLPNNTFTSAYKNYRMLMAVTNVSTDLTLTLRLRASGSDITGANYASGWIGWSITNNITGTTGNSGQTSGALLNLTSTFAMGAYALDILSPQVAEKTHIIGQAPLQQTSGAYYWFMNGGIYYNATTAADALSIICSTGNITGSYRIYGYSES